MLLQLLREVLVAGVLYAFWSASFALSAAPQNTFNLIAPVAGIVGAYAAYAAGAAWNSPLLSCLIASGVGVVFSVGCHILVVSPLLRRQKPERSVLLATLGLMGIVEAMLSLGFGSELVSLRHLGAFRAPLSRILTAPGLWIFHLLALILLLSVTLAVLGYTQAGKLYRAVCDSRRAAMFFRLPVERVDLWASALSGLVGAWSGMLLIGSRAASPNMLLLVAIWAITGTVLGGRRNLVASILGGLLLGGIEVGALQLLPAAMKDLVIGLTMVGVMLTRPEGLLTQFRRKA